MGGKFVVLLILGDLLLHYCIFNLHNLYLGATPEFSFFRPWLLVCGIRSSN
jgi:hypothetical protein